MSEIDHLPRCDCGHLFEICDAPRCYNGSECQESTTTPAQPPAVEPTHNLATGERDNEEIDSTYFEKPAAEQVTAEPWSELLKLAKAIDRHCTAIDTPGDPAAHAAEGRALRTRMRDAIFACDQATPADQVAVKALEETFNWLDLQIATARQDQIDGFKIATAAGQLKGEKSHARQCALHEAKAKLNGVLVTIRGGKHE